MRFSASTFSSLVALGLSCVNSALATPAPAGMRFEMSKRNETLGERDLVKRYDNARFTYYEVGVGACGGTNTDSEYVVALNSDQYGNGQYCWEQITIYYGGKSAVAAIVDECPGCPYAGLDLSPSLFSYFAPLSEGVIYGSWDFN